MPVGPATATIIGQPGAGRQTQVDYDDEFDEAETERHPRIVNPGDRYGKLVVRDVFDAGGFEGYGKRSVRVKCDCGVQRLLDIGELIAQGDSGFGCGSFCRLRLEEQARRDAAGRSRGKRSYVYEYARKRRFPSTMKRGRS